MDSLSLFHTISSSLLVPSIIGLVKLYADVRVLKNEQTNLNAELQEFKTQTNHYVDSLGNRIEKRLDKLENLIEKLFTYDKNN